MAGAFLVSLLVSWAVSTLGQTQNVQMGVPANACSTFQVDSGNDEYSYNVTLGSKQLASCTNVTITKYFADGACLNGDGNTGNGVNLDQITCSAKADGNSSTTCMNAIAQAKSGRTLALSNVTSGAEIDSGDSCTKDNLGYVYVQNSCSQNITVDLQFNHGPYSAVLPCAQVAGHSISGIGIAIIVIAAVLVLVWMPAVYIAPVNVAMSCFKPPGL
ncbi:hypothetical protein WJX84_002783 [Apatococcus fuscideae]|uniref:Transmembrane protein n=1 Tax=Apatococcus fuscideae TaxID=2026836 RepID=A0AAW1RMS7_9CHLO